MRLDRYEQPYPHTAPILSHLSSTQHDLTNEPQEKIRKPIIAISFPNFGGQNTCTPGGGYSRLVVYATQSRSMTLPSLTLTWLLHTSGAH